MNDLGLRTSEGFIREKGVSIVRKYTDEYFKFVTLASVRKAGYGLEERCAYDDEGNLVLLPQPQDAKLTVLKLSMMISWLTIFQGLSSAVLRLLYAINGIGSLLEL